MIVKGNPGLGIPSNYDQAQTEKIGYANRVKWATPIRIAMRSLLVHLDHAVRLGVGWRGTAASTLGGHG
jgi:hypothetical protein